MARTASATTRTNARPAGRLPRREATRLRVLLDVFKLCIGVTIGLTALAGLAVAPGSVGLWQGLGVVLAVTLASAAAGAFNQYVERTGDAAMTRTRRRAFVTGRLRAGPAWPAIIATVGLAGVALAWLAGNPVAALHTFLGAFTYGVVYTVWLKRRTAWNIVVGGLAGSFAVLAGAAAVTPVPAAVPLALALTLFLWTPPHFWSLSIAFSDDYRAAGVPMLPVVIGNERAARAVFAGAAMLVASSLLPAFAGLSWIYLACAIAGGAWLLVTSARLVAAPGRGAAMRNFHASLVQLTLLLGGAIADALILHA